MTMICTFSIALVGCGEKKISQTKSATMSDQQSKSMIPTTGMNPAQDTSSVDPTSTAVAMELATQNLATGSQEQQLAAVAELVNNGSPRAVEALAAFMATLHDGDFKEEVVRQGSEIANRESVPTCLGLVTTTGDAGVLRAAQAVLARLADAESIQMVLDAYDSGPDPRVRERLIDSVAAISNESAVPVLMQVLSDLSSPATDGMIRSSAQALRQIGTAPAVDALLERINADPTEESRSLLAAEVGRVINPLAETSLQTAASGTSKFAATPEARTSAIWALVNHPSAETREELQRLQNDTNGQVSFAATEALKSIDLRFSTCR